MSKAIDHIVSSFLRQILLQMKAMGLSQTELAKRMHVSRPYISKVLHGDVNISFGTAAKLAHALALDFSPELKPTGSVSESSHSAPIATMTA